MHKLAVDGVLLVLMPVPKSTLGNYFRGSKVCVLV